MFLGYSLKASRNLHVAMTSHIDPVRFGRCLAQKNQDMAGF